MKPLSRFLLGCAAFLLAAMPARAQSLRPTGISASPSSAAPGDSVTYTISVSNGTAVQFGPGATANFTILLTHRVTGATFTVNTGDIAPTGGFIAAAAVDPTSGQTTPGAGTFTFTSAIPTQTTEAGGYSASVTLNSVSAGTVGSSQPSVTTSVLNVTGNPDLQVTSLTYTAGTSYVGGTVIPMSLTYVNNASTNGTTNVPYTPGINGHAAFVRIQVVLSANPTFGDSDDLQLTFHDITAGNVGTTDNAGNAAVLADGATHTFNWYQTLPGNFAGSYYVMAKINSLSALTENDPPTLTINGNNIWGVPALSPEGTRINLLPSNFPATFLASHATGVTTSANGYADNPSLSSDGRYVVFASDASNLVSGDTNSARDIFIYDSQTLLVRRVNVSQQGSQGNGASNDSKISADGRYVAFSSEANNLVFGDTNGFSDIFVADAIAGLLSRVSVTTGNAQANNPSFRPAISRTGRYIVFESTATNLDAAYTVAPGSSHIYVHDRDVSGSGTFDTAGNTSTRLVDVDAGAPINTIANGASIQAAISADGTLIGFASRGTNLVAPATTAGRQHVYVRLRANVGTATSGIKLVSVADGTAAEGGADSQTPSLSSDGRYVAFASLAANLVAGDTNGVSDIFVYDTIQPVAAPVVRRMSVSSLGVQGYDPSAAGFQLGSINPTISSDGRYVAFASLAANLTNGDASGQFQGSGATATANLTGGAITSYTMTSAGSQYSQSSPPIVIITDATGAGASATAVVNAAGAVTGITVNSTGAGYTAPTVIIASDANRALDIFVRDRDALATGTFDTGTTSTQMVSVNSFGYQTSGLLGVPSTAASNIYPVLSANGRFVAFPSDAENNGGLAFGATNRLPLDSNGVRDVFLFDRRTTASITPSSPPTVTITSPGTGNTALVNTAVPVTASATAATFNGTPIGVVSSVQFFVNGTSIGTSTVFPYSTTWTPTAVGNYTLSAMVTDSFGNTGISPNVSVTIVAAPSVGVTDPVAGTSITVGTPTIVSATAGASNPGATIASVQFFANGVSLGAPVTVPPYSVTWTPGLPGTFTLTAVAIDSIGTQATSAGVQVTVVPAGGGGGGPGTTPPAVSVTAPATNATIAINLPQTVAATATATNATITSVQFFANGVLIGTTTTPPYTVTWTPAGPGPFSLIALATDSNGSQSTSTAVVVNTVGSAPTVSFNPTPPTTAAVNIPLSLTASASAAAGFQVTSVQYSIGSGTTSVAIGSATVYPFLVAWTPTTVGAYTVTAIATDNSGNKSATATAIVTVGAGTPPTVPLTSPINGASYAIGNPITVSASTALGSGLLTGVEFFANGVSIGSAGGLPFSVSFTPTAAGTYTFTAVATDSSGNRTTSSPVAVTVVAPTAPTVAVSSPANNTTLPVNVPQTITVTAGSSSGSITSVDLFANGTLVGTKSSFPYTFTWTPASEGSYAVTAVATDSGGTKTTSAAVTFRVTAGGAPTISITSPPSGSSFPVGNTVNLTASASSPNAGTTIASVQFFANGVSIGTKSSFPYTLAWTPVATGTYTLTALATDSSGATNSSAPITVTIGQNAAPSITLTSPVSGSTYGLGTGVLLAASASDSDGTVTTVQFYANGNLVGSVNTAPYTFSWRPSAPGTYQITASATDNSGNISTTLQLPVTINAGTSANVTITNPTADTSYVAGTPIPIVATTTGGNGPIASVQFFVNGTSVGGKSASPYTTLWKPVAPGTYTIVAVATDSAGISANSSPLNVTIRGGTPPTVSLTGPTTGTTVNAGAAVNLTASAAAPDGTIASVRFLANGNVVATATAAPFTAAWTPTAAGTYSVVAQATDSLGNVSNSAPVSIVVTANELPSVALTAPANGTTLRVGTGMALSATAGDRDGTITSVQFFANGTAVGTADTTPPYSVQWIPTAEGIYRITATASDNAGGSTTSSVATVFAFTQGAADVVYSGTYAGPGENGRFAAVNVRGRTAALIAFSTTSPAQTYFFPGLTVNSAGGFSAVDSNGRTIITGMAGDTGVSGTMDGGRLTFIGPILFSSGTTSVPPGYYNGNLAGRPSSLIAAIVGPDGSIHAYVTDGASFRDAGSGSVSSTGAFTVTTPSGNRITGTIDPATGFLSGSLAGGPGGAITAALSSGSSVSDGFLTNLSTRGQVGTGANVLIAGFNVAGDTSKRVLLRAVGPGLSNYGVSGVLADPQLQLYRGSVLIASNDQWSGDAATLTAMAQVGAFPLSIGSADAAIVTTLAPGAYTAQVSGVGTQTGVALLELYDLDRVTPFSGQRLTNVATRGAVGAGQSQLIAGFMISGNTSKKLLIRGVGPSLANVGLTSGLLADPFLRLVRSDNTVIRENDNWESGNDGALLADTASRVNAFGLTRGSRDAAMLISLPPGTYTAEVTGAGNSTGIGLVEVYEVQ